MVLDNQHRTKAKHSFLSIYTQCLVIRTQDLQDHPNYPKL